MDIVITTPLTPTFTQIGPLCQELKQCHALPATSNNNITGTWSPATISTTAYGTYTFTPAAGQCAATATMDVVITNSITPTFTQIGPLCQNSTAPALPATSTNNITGTWSPATISTTASGTYTFTPDAGQCGAASATMDIVITNLITPTFTQIGPLCQNLSSVAASGNIQQWYITGTWSPATISTALSGTYTFTPSSGPVCCSSHDGYCYHQLITPAFTPDRAALSELRAAPLPATSNNGITGTWNPATISTTANGHLYLYT